MTAGCRVTLSPQAIDALLAEPQAAVLVAHEARMVANEAAALAPVGATGKLRASYKSTRATVTPTGLVATAYTDDFRGHWFEWGTIKMPAYAPLRRAVTRLGLKFSLTPKGQG